MENWEHTYLVEYYEAKINTYLNGMLLHLRTKVLTPEWALKYEFEMKFKSVEFITMMDYYIKAISNNKKYEYESKNEGNSPML